MQTSTFRIVPLATETAEAARHAAGEGAADHEIITADSPGGFPCRHCLRFATTGQRMVLFPFASVPPGRPYSEMGPIFVHAEACPRYETTTQFPPDLRNGRVLRAYNNRHDMIDAEVVNGSDIEGVIEKLLQNPETAFLQVRSITRGCYTMRVERL